MAAAGKKEKVRIDREYVVPADTFKEVFDFDGDQWIRDKKSSGWREFFSQYDGPKLVNQSIRSNNKSGSVFAKHGKVKGRPWCVSCFNFSIRKPIDKDANEFVFNLSLVDVDDCLCGKFFRSA